MDAGSVRREACLQGGYPVSEHGAQDDRRCSVRQNRVVLAPVAGVKLSVANSIQPDRSAIKPAAMEARRIRLQGERGISRQTIAQGMPECSGCTCMLVCALLRAHCTRDRGCSKHPAFPAPSRFEGKDFEQTSGAMRRENADTHSTVIARLDRATQCSRDANDRTDRPQRTGSPGQAGRRHQKCCHSVRVIASEAKQSISPHKERMDCFASLAMTWMGPRVRTKSTPTAPPRSYRRR